MVKTLGDSVLFMSQSPEDGVEIAWDIVQMIGGDERLPDVRVGLVTGPVVLRMGDVYGPAVNLAARLVGVARRNRVITDAHTAAATAASTATRPGCSRPGRCGGSVTSSRSRFVVRAEGCALPPPRGRVTACLRRPRPNRSVARLRAGRRGHRRRPAGPDDGRAGCGRLGIPLRLLAEAPGVSAAQVVPDHDGR